MLDAVRKIAPYCKAPYLAGFDSGDAALEQAGINTPLRQAHFIAQFAGETDGGVVLYESGAYTSVSRIMQIFGAGHHSAAIQTGEAERIVAMAMPAREKYLFERVYGAGNPHKMAELGNRPGDGYPFRGTGVLQLVGRGTAKRCGDKLGVDFQSNPALMLDPKYVLAPALFEWTTGSLNRFADLNDIRHIRRVITGGYNRFAECEEWFEKAYAVLRDPEKDPVESWRAGFDDPAVSAIQNSLSLIGYLPALKPDGRYGPKTKAAVRWFQEIARILVDEIAGPVTLTALNLRFASKH